jgi:hypothetical protein
MSREALAKTTPDKPPIVNIIINPRENKVYGVNFIEPP